jgi:hypothetical protein
MPLFLQLDPLVVKLISLLFNFFLPLLHFAVLCALRIGNAAGSQKGDKTDRRNDR